jgi:hypothetical protein
MWATTVSPRRLRWGAFLRAITAGEYTTLTGTCGSGRQAPLTPQRQPASLVGAPGHRTAAPLSSASRGPRLVPRRAGPVRPEPQRGVSLRPVEFLTCGPSTRAIDSARVVRNGMTRVRTWAAMQRRFPRTATISATASLRRLVRGGPESRRPSTPRRPLLNLIKEPGPWDEERLDVFGDALLVSRRSLELKPRSEKRLRNLVRGRERGAKIVISFCGNSARRNLARPSDQQQNATGAHHEVSHRRRFPARRARFAPADATRSIPRPARSAASLVVRQRGRAAVVAAAPLRRAWPPALTAGVAASRARSISPCRHRSGCCSRQRVSA